MLNTEWRNWVEENILRGVSEDELVRILQENNFAKDESYQVVQEYAHQHRGDSGLVLEQASAPEETVEAENTYESRPPCLDYGRWPIVMEVTDPVVVVYNHVLTPEECGQMMALSRSKLERSTTVDMETGGTMEHEARTSEGTFFEVYENALITDIENRLSRLMNLPVENGEGIQILRYGVGGEYKPHYDYFPPEYPGSHVHIKDSGQRVATLILYLNEPEAGGETIFPELNLKVRPVKGSAVYFSYFHRGKVDPRTLHGGAPVIQGEKWIATKWVRERRYSNNTSGKTE